MSDSGTAEELNKQVRLSYENKVGVLLTSIDCEYQGRGRPDIRL